jgi:hypothetical protein
VSGVWAWFASGGPTMIALGAVALALGFLVVERYLAIGAQLRALRDGRPRQPAAPPGAVELAGLRRMGLIRACIVIAPLLGLLGTVSGMIDTFESILRGGYITEMSLGIRTALLTTQYGLAIAAPGLLAEQALLRRLERLTQAARAARRAGRQEEPCNEAC